MLETVVYMPCYVSGSLWSNKLNCPRLCMSACEQSHCRTVISQGGQFGGDAEDDIQKTNDPCTLQKCVVLFTEPKIHWHCLWNFLWQYPAFRMPSHTQHTEEISSIFKIQRDHSMVGVTLYQKNWKFNKINWNRPYKELQRIVRCF